MKGSFHMMRVFGIMPTEEVTMQESYIDGMGGTIIIQAGPNGWSILYADGSADYCDEVNEDTINFQKAYDKVNENIGPLTKISCVDDVEEVVSEDTVNNYNTSDAIVVNKLEEGDLIVKKRTHDVVTLIGSTKLKDKFKIIADILTKHGYIVLYPRCYDFDNSDIQEETQSLHVSMHKQMIDMSDFVIVVHDSEENLTSKTLAMLNSHEPGEYRYLGENTIELIQYCFGIQRCLIDINSTETFLGISSGEIRKVWFENE